MSVALSPGRLRRIILDQSRRANVGHIGSALSIVDILATLYSSVLDVKRPTDPDRDRFILSKGHAALALYAVLHLKGWMNEGELDTYCADDSRLGVHPERSLPGIDFATGSLGHGLSMGAGAALAARLQNSKRRTYVLMSDAECNEGSVWEAAMFAAHHRLSNLIAIIDLNGQQALGYTNAILDLDDMKARWSSFGWRVVEVDGHDSNALSAALVPPADSTGMPTVVIARTVFGRAVSYMQSQIKWHYMPMSEIEYETALKEIEELE